MSGKSVRLTKNEVLQRRLSLKLRERKFTLNAQWFKYGEIYRDENLEFVILCTECYNDKTRVVKKEDMTFEELNKFTDHLSAVHWDESSEQAIFHNNELYLQRDHLVPNLTNETAQPDSSKSTPAPNSSSSGKNTGRRVSAKGGTKKTALPNSSSAPTSTLTSAPFIKKEKTEETARKPDSVDKVSNDLQNDEATATPSSTSRSANHASRLRIKQEANSIISERIEPTYEVNTLPSTKNHIKVKHERNGDASSNICAPDVTNTRFRSKNAILIKQEKATNSTNGKPSSAVKKEPLGWGPNIDVSPSDMKINLKCGLCPLTDYNVNTIRAHMLEVHGITEAKRSFFCPYCDTRLFIQSRLRTHIKRVHPEYEAPKLNKNGNLKRPSTSKDDEDEDEDNYANNDDESDVTYAISTRCAKKPKKK